MTNFYDADGTLFAVVHDGKHIQIARTAHHAGWVWGRHMFSYTGEHIGFWDRGWMRDREGRPVGWSEEASGSGPEGRSGAMKHPMGSPPDTPRRGSIPSTPDFEDHWARINGRAFFACYHDGDGEARPLGEGTGVWERALARQRETAAEYGEQTGFMAPLSEEEVAAMDSAVVDEDSTVDASSSGASGDFDAAVAAYRAAYNSDDKQALAVARVDLHAAAEKHAILGA